MRDAAKLHEQSEALAAAYVDGMPLETAMVSVTNPAIGDVLF